MRLSAKGQIGPARWRRQSISPPVINVRAFTLRACYERI